MSTPPRLLELQCPQCKVSHFELDCDFRGMGGPRQGYEERDYSCPHCTRQGSGYTLLRGSPPEFFLQPHDMYPMSIESFAEWLTTCRIAFPENGRLEGVGVRWYPGKHNLAHDEAMSRARTIGELGPYWATLSNQSAADTRARVCIQRPGEAHFLVDPIELDVHDAGFDKSQLQSMPELLAANDLRIRAAWRRFHALAAESHARWAAKLGFKPVPPSPAPPALATIERVETTLNRNFWARFFLPKPDEWVLHVDGTEVRITNTTRSMKLLKAGAVLAESRAMTASDREPFLRAAMHTGVRERTVEVFVRVLFSVKVKVVVDGLEIAEEFL